MAISRISIIKFLELAITVVCLWLHYETFAAPGQHGLMISTGTFFGYLIILIGAFAGHLMSAPFNRRIDIFFSLAGCALFIASGVFAIQQYEGSWSSDTKNKGIAKGSLAIINGAIFLVDSLVTWRGDY